MLFQFLFSFSLLFLLLPRFVVRFEPGQSGWIEKLFICLVHSSLFLIVAVELLAFVRLYETISLLAVTAIALLGADRMLYGNRSRVTNFLTKLYDLSDDPKNNYPHWLRERAHAVGASFRRALRSTWHGFRRNWFAATLIMTTLAYGAYLRFHHSIKHYYFGAADPYVHMTFAKNLGANQIFSGLYPPGYPAILSAISNFFIMDLYDIIRYIGPTAGMLLVLSIFFALRKIVGNRLPIVFAALFVYVAYSELPSFLWRQMSALSMEYATIFLLPGIAFLIEYFRKKRFSDLLLAGECLALTVLIHPYTAVTLALSYIIVYAAYWKTALNRNTLLSFTKVMGISGTAASLPQIYAFLTVPFDGMTYVRGNVQGYEPIPASQWLGIFLNDNKLVIFLLTFGVAVMLWRTFGTLRHMGRIRPTNATTKDSAVVAAFLLFIVFYIVYRSAEYGLPRAIPADRFGVYFALLAALIVGVVLYQLASAIRRTNWRRIAEYSLSVLLAASVLATGQVNSAPSGDRYQYDEAVEMYLHIKENYPLLDWTIVSPMEENHLVIGYGWHYQLWEFVRTLEFPEDQSLEIPTQYVFFFVEKVPLPSATDPSPVQGPVTSEEADAPFPTFDGEDTTEFYYRSETNRRILEAKMFKWAEAYRRKHENMTIYYDSPEFRVYKVQSNKIHNFLH